MSDVRLTGAAVVASLSPPQVFGGEVSVAEGRIVGGDHQLRRAEEIDCSERVIIPGNVCAHHHLYSALARGMPYRLDPPTNFLEILQRVWWRLDRALDQSSIAASAWVGGAEALLAGTTTIVDHHASPGAVAESLEGVSSPLDLLGARSIHCYEVSDRDGMETALAGLDESRRFLKESRRLARGMVGAHASFTLSDETLGACVDLAREHAVGVHIHVAEDAVDQDSTVARFGRRVVHRLAEAGALDERSLLAHCVHVDETEAEAIRSAGATVVHNPRSNMNNRVGHAPILAFDRLALGTDGIDGDMFAESRSAYWRARESGASVSPQWALDGLAASARFAGAVFDEPLLGTLEAGAPADLVVLDYRPPTPLTEDTLAAHWMFGMGARHVRDVMVNGEWVVRDRRLVRADLDRITAGAVEQSERLWERMDAIEPHPFHPGGLE